MLVLTVGLNVLSDVAAGAFSIAAIAHVNDLCIEHYFRHELQPIDNHRDRALGRDRCKPAKALQMQRLVLLTTKFEERTAGSTRLHTESKNLEQKLTRNQAATDKATAVA